MRAVFPREPATLDEAVEQFRLFLDFEAAVRVREGDDVLGASGVSVVPFFWYFDPEAEQLIRWWRGHDATPDCTKLLAPTWIRREQPVITRVVAADLDVGDALLFSPHR